MLITTPTNPQPPLAFHRKDARQLASFRCRLAMGKGDVIDSSPSLAGAFIRYAIKFSIKDVLNIRGHSRTCHPSSTSCGYIQEAGRTNSLFWLLIRAAIQASLDRTLVGRASTKHSYCSPFGMTSRQIAIATSERNFARDTRLSLPPSGELFRILDTNRQQWSFGLHPTPILTRKSNMVARLTGPS